MDKYKKWEDPPVLKNTTKCLFFSSLHLNWHPFAAHLLGHFVLCLSWICSYIQMCYCVCVEVFVSWEELVIKVPRWRRAIPGPLYSVLMRICSQTHSHMAGSDFNHWLCHCIYSHLRVLQILQHATLMRFITREKLESVYFIIKGKGSVLIWKIWETCLGIKKQSNFIHTFLYKSIVILFTVNALTESKALLKIIK